MKHLDLLLSAVLSSTGVEIETNSPVNLRAELYASVREAKAAGDETFSELSFHLSPLEPERKLWIAKRKGKRGEPIVATNSTPVKDSPHGD